MQPITAQIRRVPSVSSLFKDDFTWSIGTSQAPTAGVAVLRRFNCLIEENKKKKDTFTFSSSTKQVLLLLLWITFKEVEYKRTMLKNNEHKLILQKMTTSNKYIIQILFYTHIHDSIHSCCHYSPRFLFALSTAIIKFDIIKINWIPN